MFWRSFFLSCLVVIVASVGLACHTPSHPYAKYATHTGPAEGSYVPDMVPVYVDAEFTPFEKADIAAAFAEWNYAFNGYRIYVVMSDEFTLEDEATIEKVVKTHQGLIVLRRESDNLPSGISRGVLAWVNMGTPVIHIIADRFGTRDLKMVTMHEIGHTLGLDHIQVIGTLMSEYYQGQTNCVDRITAQAVSYQNVELRWDWRHMNYCNRPE